MGVHGPLHRQVGAVDDHQVDGEEGGHGDDTSQEVPDLQPHMDEARDETGQAAHHQRDGKRQVGVHAVDQQDRRHRGTQGEGAVHTQVGEVKNRIGDVDAEGDQRVNQPLGQGADQKVCHAEPLLSEYRDTKAAKAGGWEITQQ